MTYGNIARPYPETVEALEAKLREAEHDIEALRLRLGQAVQEVAIAEERIADEAERIQGLQQTIDHQAKQDGERIAALEAENARLHGELLAAQMGLTVCTGHLRDTGQHRPTRAEEPVTLAEPSADQLECLRNLEANEERD